MNNLDKFFELYRKNLLTCIQADPDAYGFSDGTLNSHYETWADMVAGRMKTASQNGSFNHDGPAFKATCKELKIKYTRGSILTFIEGS